LEQEHHLKADGEVFHLAVGVLAVSAVVEAGVLVVVVPVGDGRKLVISNE
jgi:hypothetical protein